MDIREARTARGWSQEELAERTGVSARTIQRIENGSRPSTTTARLLADALERRRRGLSSATSAGERRDAAPPVAAVVDAVREAVRRLRGSGTGAPDYWWFFLAVTILYGAATALSEAVGTAVGVCSRPLAAAGARRLHDTGRSGWWQLFALAPFGFVVLLVLLARPTDDAAACAYDEPELRLARGLSGAAGRLTTTGPRLPAGPCAWTAALDQPWVGKPRLMPPWLGSSQREVTTLPRVKKCTPSGPCAWVSPNSELFQPPNE